MSRCFPFPPPGYEKKIRTDAADSLIKENHKEKKHKKDKKDKEKKERKEKKDKETSKDKHKDKERKEKKDKHKDRKDKERDIEKSRTSEDTRVTDVLPNTGNREKHITKTLQNNGNGETKFVQDLARRIRDEEATDSQSAQKINFPNGVTESNIPYPVPQTNHRKDEDKRINTHSNFPMAKRSENSVLRVSSCMDQKGDKVMVKPVEKKDMLKKTELQEKNHRRDSDKPLDNNGIKKSEPKNITDRSSKEKKEEKLEGINKTGQEKPKFVEGGPRLKEREHESVDMKNSRVPELSRSSTRNLTSEGILSKRKDHETNGLLYENGFRPNKIHKPVASPISSMENGRKLVAFQTPPKPSSELQGTVCNSELKEHRINGFINSQELKSRPPVSSVKAKENGEASAKKRPHSDLKYLDQILNVPKREEMCEVDDDEQEWLLGLSGMNSLKKQRTVSTTSLDESQQVWNQALNIESADIIALPYVVPF